MIAHHRQTLIRTHARRSVPKKALIAGLVGVALAVPLSWVTAGSLQQEPAVAVAAAAALVDDPLRAMAFSPNEQRPFSAMPRIIHVPQPGDDRAALEDDIDDAPEAPVRRVRPQAMKPLPPRTTPRWTARNEPQPAPPPAAPPRKILGAVPPIHDGPSPIRPLPRYDAKKEPGEKFAPLPRADISPSPPPPAEVAGASTPADPAEPK